MLHLDESSAELTGTDGLPPYALAMMAADEDLARALEVHRELERQERTITTSELLITELEPIIGAGTGMGGAQKLRYDIILAIHEAVDDQLRALSVEHEWLQPSAGRHTADVQAAATARTGLEQAALDALRDIQDVKIELDEWNRELQDLQAELQQLTIDRDDAVRQLETFDSVLASRDDSAADEQRLREHLRGLDAREVAVQNRLEELDAGGVLARITRELDDSARVLAEDLAAKVEELRLDTQRLRSTIAPAGAAANGRRLDDAHASLEASRARLAVLRGRLDDAEATEMERIRQRFRYEIDAVAGQRREHGNALDGAEDVSVDLTRARFGRLEGFFSESLLSADMGIVDVYWAQKVEVADRMKSVTEERNALLEELDRRFALLRQKMDQ